MRSRDKPYKAVYQVTGTDNNETQKNGNVDLISVLFVYTKNLLGGKK